MEITWITQGGFIIENTGYRLVVDPYLSDIVEKTVNLTRLVQVPVELEQLKPDTVFCTHNHIDHLDPVAIPQIAAFYPECRFIGPESVTDDLTEMSVDSTRITTLKTGSKIEIEGFELTAVPANHSDPYSVGLVIKADNKKIYISGDTRYYPELPGEILNCSGGNINLVLICINGKLNNMGIDEAVHVVRELEPRLASPMHYGLFAENTADPEPFAEKCRKIGIEPYLFTVGQKVNLDELLAGVKDENR